MEKGGYLAMGVLDAIAVQLEYCVGLRREVWVGGGVVVVIGGMGWGMVWGCGS